LLFIALGRDCPIVHLETLRSRNKISPTGLR
jgi:hypothetical protein